LNLSETGSMDKTILESLACGCPTLTSNVAAFQLLERLPHLTVRNRTPEAIGAQICRLYEQRRLVDANLLRGLVVGRHDLDSYVTQVYDVLSELAGLARAPMGVAPACDLAHG
jgi:hypothetical protein